LPQDWRERAAKLGADVPACVESRTAIGRGTGTELEPGPNDLAGTPVLLVNPRVPLSTAPVFKGWDGVDRGKLPSGTAREIAHAGRNDLEAPAMALCPAIGAVLQELRATTAAWIVRLTGSGATGFALFDTPEQRDGAATSLRQSRPEWWQMSGSLR
jgi:4-diphosphocytidyl-2-C-methyl-D-erythritol kinase